MRMRRKKHLDDRMDECAAQIINMKPADLRFGTETAGEVPPLAALFGNDRPVELEIGCGKGGFVCAMAARYPERNFVAVEKYGNVSAPVSAGAQHFRAVS